MASRQMCFGLYLPPMGPLGDPAVLVDLAARAERAGWDGVFLWDHVLADGMPIADTWTTLAAMAVSTARIVIGPMVTPVPRRRPWVVARQAATVSALARGRLVLGLGLGVDETGDLSRFGENVELPVLRERLIEGIQIIRAMWAGDALEHNSFANAASTPATDTTSSFVATPVTHGLPSITSTSRRWPKPERHGGWRRSSTSTRSSCRCKSWTPGRRDSRGRATKVPWSGIGREST
jgi:hypothetical protein